MGRCGQCPVLSVEFLEWVHEAFYTRRPEDLHWAEDATTGRRVKSFLGRLARAA